MMIAVGFVYRNGFQAGAESTDPEQRSLLTGWPRRQLVCLK